MSIPPHLNDVKGVIVSSPLQLQITPSDHPDAHLIEQIERYGNQYQRHQVRRCDNGSHNHDNQERMLAITGKN